VQPSVGLDRGHQLGFTLYGTPAGKAEIIIAGAKGRFFLDEVKKRRILGHLQDQAS
jgi:hypothetical protein